MSPPPRAITARHKPRLIPPPTFTVMEDDYSDILGSGVLNVKPQSGLSYGVKASLWICALVILYTVGATAWHNFLKWRELSYRLAMRRRYGIPDDDHRPFNVAYAAVQRAREQREALRRAKSRPMSNMTREQALSSAQPKQDLRQRAGVPRNVEATWMKDRTESLPGGYRQNVTAGPSRHNHVNNGQQTVLHNEEKVLYPRATELVTSANHPVATASTRITNQSDSRRRNSAYMDGDQGTNGANHSRGSDAEALQRATFKRGSKREYGDAEGTEDVLESKRVREKRARKVSREKEISDEDMEVDENELEEENEEYGQVSRGKKRDREEAGSTFGGDDEDSEREAAEDDATTRQRSRKRRTVAKRKSDIAVTTRGKKRDRDIDEETSEDTSDRDYHQASSRKRRNKKEGVLGKHLEEEDISMEESPARGKSRRIGEEWTSNGVLYKIGPNGQRLRQSLVKKARQKYSMPQDSQHPDRDANLEVYVETWLTEEEYQDAKARHSLAWQDTPKAFVERDTHEVAQPPPSPVGKSLLWKSAATSSVTTPDGGCSPTSEFSGSTYPTTKGRISYDPRRQSIAVDVAMRVNPFHQYPAQASKRIGSGTMRISSAGLIDSTNSSPRTGHRIYSKWEKQDLEAKAMMKMREVARKKETEEKERQEKERLEKERAEREKAEKEKAAMPSVPIITITKPAEDKPSGTGTPNLFTKPAEPAKLVTKQPAVAASSFSFPSFSKPSETTMPTTENKASALPTVTPAPTPFTFAPSGPSPFATVAKPSVDSAKPSEQPPSSSAPPQPTGPTATSHLAPATSTTSFFSSPKPFAVPEPKNPEQHGLASSPALLSRLSGVTSNAAPTSQPHAFSFTKLAEAPKSFFGTLPTTSHNLAVQPSASTSTTSTASNGATGASGLKFDFGVQNKSTTTTVATPGTTAPDAPKPDPGANIFSFKSTTAPPVENNTATGGPTPFRFTFNGTNSQTAKGAGGDSGTHPGKQTGAFDPPTDPTIKSASLGFGNMGTADDKTPQPSFGTIGTKNAQPTFTGFNANFNTTTPSGATTGDGSKATSFSTFSNVQAPSSTGTSDTSRPSAFNPFASGLSTTAFGSSGAPGGMTSSAAHKPIDSTNVAFVFGKTSSAPAAVPTITTSSASDVPNPPSIHGLNDHSKAQSSSSAPSTSATKFSFVSTGPNPFQTASGSGGSTTQSTPVTLGAGGSGPSAPNSATSSTLSGALGGSGQSASGPTTSSTSFGAPGSQSSTFNAASTPSAFRVPPSAQSGFPTSQTNQSLFGALGGQSVSSTAPAAGSSLFGGASIFDNASSTKLSTSLFGPPVGAQSVFSNASQPTNNSTPQNSTSTFQFGQSPMNTLNSTGGQS